MENKIKTANEILADFHNSQKQAAQSAEQPANQEPANQEPPATAPPAAEPPAQEPGKDLESDLSNWDPDGGEEPKKSDKWDFTTWVKDTGFDDVKSEDEFKAKIRELKTKTSELEGVPDGLKRAISLAKKGGDYLSYLKVSQVDYSKISPEAIYEHYVRATLTPEEAQAHLEALSPVDRKMRGLEKRNEYIAAQKQQETELERASELAERDAAAKRERADTKLRETLNNVNEIAGLKLQPKHKSDIYDAISTGRMQRELFFDSKTGEYDFNNMIETYFVKKNLPKILSFIEGKAKTATKKEILKEMTNASVTTTPDLPTSDPDTRTPLQKYVESLESQWKKK